MPPTAASNDAVTHASCQVDSKIVSRTLRSKTDDYVHLRRRLLRFILRNHDQREALRRAGHEPIKPSEG